MNNKLQFVLKGTSVGCHGGGGRGCQLLFIRIVRPSKRLFTFAVYFDGINHRHTEWIVGRPERQDQFLIGLD